MNAERVSSAPEVIESVTEQPGRRQYQQIGEAALRQESTGRQRMEKTPRTTLTMQTFTGVVPETKIRRDERYVERLDQRFERDPNSGSAAKAFERLFIYGIQTGAWLGNLPDEAGQPPFTVRTFETTKYDDYRHRVDSFTTLRFAEPYEAENGAKMRAIPLAFDVTINSGRQAIMDKLTRCYNDDAELPFGFTHLDYYTNGRVGGACELLPRYVIGVSEEEAKEAKEQLVRRSPDGKLMPPHLLSVQNLRTRFKVLSEVRAQNLLFQAMLPDDVEESVDPRLRKASAYLEATDAQLNEALQICAAEMVTRRCLPTEILTQIQRDGKAQSVRKVIEEYLLKISHENFMERQRENATRRGTIYIPDEQEDDTYVQILQCARDLTDAAYAEEGYPKVAARRKAMAQNEALEL